MSASRAVRRWKCVCAYDGTAFAGWQSQAGGKAIQDVIEARVAQIFKQPLRIHGSGRTDAGVHAHGQVFHFDAEWPHATEKLLAAFRVGLPAGIQIKSIVAVSAKFHARFDAAGKPFGSCTPDLDPRRRRAHRYACECRYQERPRDDDAREHACTLHRCP